MAFYPSDASRFLWYPFLWNRPFSLQNFIRNEKDRKIYHYLNAFGLTPWIAIHLFYTMLFVLFAWLHNNGCQEKASVIVEALYHRFSWFVLAGQFVMLPVYFFWFYLQVAGKTIFPKIFSLTNVLFILMILKGLSHLLPNLPYKIAFINGLMSESMFLWFMLMILFNLIQLVKKDQQK